MKVRKSCNLVKLYKETNHPIDSNFAELRLIRAACEGDVETAVSIFREKKLFSNDPCVDEGKRPLCYGTPGRFRCGR
jgi:hypothetical protein